MIDFRVDAKNLKDLDRRLEAFGTSLGRTDQMWRMILVRLRALEKEQFSEMNGFVGKSTVDWPDYFTTFQDRNEALKYMDWKNRQNPGSATRLLRLSDRLMKSLTEQTKDSHVVISKWGMSFGTKVPYAPYHNKTKGGRSPAPPPYWRPFLHWNIQLQTIVDTQSALFVNKRLREFFR